MLFVVKYFKKIEINISLFYQDKKRNIRSDGQRSHLIKTLETRQNNLPNVSRQSSLFILWHQTTLCLLLSYRGKYPSYSLTLSFSNTGSKYSVCN